MRTLFFSLLLCFCFMGCATMPTSQEIAGFDYGEPLTIDYQKAVKDYFSNVLLDPYSAVYEFESEPQQFWTKGGLLTGGGLYTGYAVYVTVNAKNRMGGYVGKERYCFVFKNNKIIKVISPEELGLMRNL